MVFGEYWWNQQYIIILKRNMYRWYKRYKWYISKHINQKRRCLNNICKKGIAIIVHELKDNATGFYKKCTYVWFPQSRNLIKDLNVCGYVNYYFTIFNVQLNALYSFFSPPLLYSPTPRQGYGFYIFQSHF